jgi:GMP synthase (glutamine-hydrolysing)
MRAWRPREGCWCRWAGVELLRAWLAAGAPVLGFCLGAQLLALAAGGGAGPLTVGDPPARLREVGFGAIDFRVTAAEEPLLADLPSSLLVLHWHGDRIHLPPGARLLASSLLCPEQIFRIGSRAFGLQCHIEVRASALERWLEEDREFIAAALGAEGEARLRSDAARWLQNLEAPWRRLLTNLLAQASR